MLLLSRRGNARAPAAPRGVRGKERSEQPVKTRGVRLQGRSAPDTIQKVTVQSGYAKKARLAKVRLRVGLV